MTDLDELRLEMKEIESDQVWADQMWKLTEQQMRTIDHMRKVAGSVGKQANHDRHTDMLTKLTWVIAALENRKLVIGPEIRKLESAD